MAQNHDDRPTPTTADPRPSNQFPHFDTLAALHRDSSQKGVPTYPHDRCTLADIHGTIEDACATSGIGVCLAALLMARLNSRGTKLIALRATPARYFADNFVWTIMEWVESDGLMALAIFHFDNPEEFSDGSWLMHHGQGFRLSGASAFPEWTSCGISWDVTQAGHLKVMFCVAEHTLGISQWPASLAVTVFRDKSGEPDSLQEYLLIVLNTDLQGGESFVSTPSTNRIHGNSFWTVAGVYSTVLYKERQEPFYPIWPLPEHDSGSLRLQASFTL